MKRRTIFYLKFRLLFILTQMKGDLAIMAKLESKFQKEAIDQGSQNTDAENTNKYDIRTRHLLGIQYHVTDS